MVNRKQSHSASSSGAAAGGAAGPLSAGEAPVPGIAELVRSEVSAALRDQANLDLIAGTISDAVTAAVLVKIRADVERNTAEINALKKSVSEYERKTRKLEEQLSVATDELEQYQRRNSLRVFGVAEDEAEDTDNQLIQIVQEKLGIEVCKADIDRSHRVGRKVSGATKPRPIIVKFVSYRKRAEIFREKRKLAKTGLTIREDLTRERLKLLNNAISHFGLQNVWTQDGRVIIKTPTGKKTVTNMCELNNIK